MSDPRRAPRAEPLVCLVTHPPEGAERFARRLVEARLAACVNRLEAASAYRWQGEVLEEREVLLVIKTARAELARLERFLADEHPYDVPELVLVSPAHVGALYRAWWLGELGGESAP